jgi:glutamate synthase (NADPH) large chain
VHHFACLAGYGAEAINPWLAFDTCGDGEATSPRRSMATSACKRFIKSVDKGC